MISSNRDKQDQHVRQEAEANVFSIELLAPRGRLKPYLDSAPDLTMVRQMASDFEISREAAARRYVELHDETLAVVFCSDGKFNYASRKDGFPSLCLRRGQPLSLAAGTGTEGEISRFDEVDPTDWLNRPGGVNLSAQTLFQQRGFSTTLLRIYDSDEDEELDDTYERFTGLQRRR